MADAASGILAPSGVAQLFDVEIGEGRFVYGAATEIRAKRAETVEAAYAANPARFCHRWPTPPKLPTVAWINKPSAEARH